MLEPILPPPTLSLSLSVPAVDPCGTSSTTTRTYSDTRAVFTYIYFFYRLYLGKRGEDSAADGLSQAYPTQFHPSDSVCAGNNPRGRACARGWSSCVLGSSSVGGEIGIY